MSAGKRSVRAAALVVGAAAIAAALTACARPGPATKPATTTNTAAPDRGARTAGTITTAPPAQSASDLPTPAPSSPPQQPTDQLPTDIVVGQVTAVAGHCYSVLTGEDKLYALYGAAVSGVHVNDAVRVKVKPLEVKIACGPGQPAQIVSISVVG